MITLNLIEFAKKIKSLKKILFSSTSEIYSGTLKHFGIKIPTNEEVKLTLDDIKSPRTTYMLSKMYGESLFFSYGEKYNIPFTIVRYHNVYGPRMGFLHVIPEMLLKISHQKKVEVASPKHTRSMCYVDDAIKMTIRACKKIHEQRNPKYWQSRSRDFNCKFSKDNSKILNKNIQISYLPDTKGSPKRRCPDVSKIKKMTGYTCKVGLEKGIKKTYKWYKDRLHNKYE